MAHPSSANRSVGGWKCTTSTASKSNRTDDEELSDRRLTPEKRDWRKHDFWESPPSSDADAARRVKSLGLILVVVVVVGKDETELVLGIKDLRLDDVVVVVVAVDEEEDSTDWWSSSSCKTCSAKPTIRKELFVRRRTDGSSPVFLQYRENMERLGLLSGVVLPTVETEDIDSSSV